LFILFHSFVLSLFYSWKIRALTKTHNNAEKKQRKLVRLCRVPDIFRKACKKPDDNVTRSRYTVTRFTSRFLHCTEILQMTPDALLMPSDRPTWSRLVEPSHRPLHRLGNLLEQRYADDAARTQHHWFKRDIVEQGRIVAGRQLSTVERMNEADTQNAQVFGRVSTGLDEERPLSIHLFGLYTSTPNSDTPFPFKKQFRPRMRGRSDISGMKSSRRRGKGRNAIVGRFRHRVAGSTDDERDELLVADSFRMTEERLSDTVQFTMKPHVRSFSHFLLLWSEAHEEDHEGSDCKYKLDQKLED
jgi:hypothetical protein